MKFSKDYIFYWLPVFYNAYIGKKGFFVIGYTKSGTNWLKNLIRHYYGIKLLPRYTPGDGFLGERIYHMHRFLPTKFYRASSVYLVRDGRDTVVSRYFTMVKQKSQSLMKNDFIKYCGKEPTKENIKELLPDYITFLITYHKSTIDYRSHVKKAMNEGYFIVKYEDLLANTTNTLRKVLRHYKPNEQVNEERLKEVIDYHSFEASVKRQKKDTGFFRKGGGTSGDWRNHFTNKCAKVYDHYAGDVLIQLGYEKDHNWVNAF